MNKKKKTLEQPACTSSLPKTVDDKCKVHDPEVAANSDISSLAFITVGNLRVVGKSLFLERMLHLTKQTHHGSSKGGVQFTIFPIAHSSVPALERS